MFILYRCYGDVNGCGDLEILNISNKLVIAGGGADKSQILMTIITCYVNMYNIYFIIFYPINDLLFE